MNSQPEWRLIGTELSSKVTEVGRRTIVALQGFMIFSKERECHDALSMTTAPWNLAPVSFNPLLKCWEYTPSPPPLWLPVQPARFALGPLLNSPRLLLRLNQILSYPSWSGLRLSPPGSRPQVHLLLLTQPTAETRASGYGDNRHGHNLRIPTDPAMMT